ncbi:MAG TPA: metallopeptidase family protein [Thermodesulfobacteriota bacterium]|nr:metallopeptidase family protein [Thermodesulfobacteriota bacterium]
MDREKFEKLVEKAYEEIPEVFKERMENIEVIVEDFPTPEDLERLGIRSKSSLLGLYRGTPLPHRSVWQGVRLPDTIVLFQRNIEGTCRYEEEVEEKVKEVLVHEIGHYFGLSDEEIYELMGYRE